MRDFKDNAWLYGEKDVSLPEISRHMKKFVDHIGLILIVVGTLTLAATRLQTLSSSNTLLAAGMLSVVVGIVAHIYSIKREGRY